MTTFRIKRSPTSGNPSTLAQGELAYSYLTNNGSNGGDTLYIGTGTETGGNAANHVKIGGLYYTTQIDNATSSNTASTIVKRDSSGNFTAGTITAALTGNASTASKWYTARNLSFTGDATATLSSVDGSADVSAALTLANVNSNVNSLAITAASGNGSTVTLTYATQVSNPYTVGQQITVTGVSPSGYNGTYTVTSVSTTQVQFASTYTTAYTSGGTVIGLFGSATYIPVITVNAKGLITAISNQAISTTLSLAAGGGTTGSVNLLSGSLTVSGGNGITTSVSGSTITISSIGAGGYTSTATAAGTTTLTSSSTANQWFTGTSTQTVKLPSTATLTLGQEYIITNNSTGAVTVQNTSASTITTIPGGSQATFTVASVSAETWVSEFTGNNTLTGTGAQVLANAPTLTGHPTIEGVTSTGATGTGNLVFSAAPTITGHPTIEGVTSTGATGTGNFVFATSPSISAPTLTGHPTIEGVTSTGATGTGNLVFSASPTFSGTATIATLNLTNALGVAYGGTGTTNGSITGTGTLTFTAGGSNTSIDLVPQGTGTVDVASKRITSVATPTMSSDAANKAYVDAATQGLNVHDSVDIFADTTNTAITGATYTDGTTDTSGGLGIGATLTDSTTGTVLAIDGYTVQLGDRVLVDAFTSSNAKYNGIYTLTTVGVSGSVKWVLTRATDFNNSTSGQVRPGDFTFIYRGTNYAKTGWVQTSIGTGTPFETIKIGTDAITWTQFSGAGTYIADGTTLTLTGSTFSINTSYAGQASITTLGTISSGTWHGSLVSPTYGGTGVNNGSNTITIGGNVSTGGAVTFSGAYGFTGTLTNTTSVTFPTSGTLVNTAVTTLSSLSSIGTITVGVWNGTAIGPVYGGTGLTSYTTGDTIYASGSNTLSKLSIGSTGQIMQVNSSGVPVWGDLDGGTY